MPWQSSIRHLLASDERKPCFAPQGHAQPHDSGPASFLLTMINTDTGEVRKTCACCAHAAWWCYQVGLQAEWAALRVPSGVALAFPWRGTPRPPCPHILPWESKAS